MQLRSMSGIAREGVGSLGSGGAAPSNQIAQTLDAVPQAGSYIAGPALPPPRQGLAHQFAAHSASVSHAFATFPNAM